MTIVMVTTCVGRSLEDLLRRHLSFRENLVSKGANGRPPNLAAPNFTRRDHLITMGAHLGKNNTGKRMRGQGGSLAKQLYLGIGAWIIQARSLLPMQSIVVKRLPKVFDPHPMSDVVGDKVIVLGSLKFSPEAAQFVEEMSPEHRGAQGDAVPTRFVRSSDVVPTVAEPCWLFAKQDARSHKAVRTSHHPDVLVGLEILHLLSHPLPVRVIIGILDGDEFAAREKHPRGQGSGVSYISRENNQPNARLSGPAVLSRPAFHYLRRPVRRGIVHNDDFDVPVRLCLQAQETLCDVLFAVVNGHNHAHQAIYPSGSQSFVPSFESGATFRSPQAGCVQNGEPPKPGDPKIPIVPFPSRHSTLRAWVVEDPCAPDDSAVP